jgi:elongation factor P--(R)-beta-lysine ligase
MEQWNNLPMTTTHLKQRSQIVQSIRKFFDERGYTEMHTPRLVGLPGQEPYLEPFWTKVVEQNGASHPAALITSPEYAMKRLLAAGMDRIYDLGPCFRNHEPWDGTHDPEFLMLEWYRRDGELDSLMDETEEMVKFVHRESGVVSRFSEAQNNDVRLTTYDLRRTPFRRLTCAEAWQQYANEDLDALLDNRGAMKEVAERHGQTVLDSDTWDDLYFKVFLTEIEPRLGEEPTFLYRYPASMAALARRSKDDPRYADRTELYMGGLELANGFAELCDPVEQRARFKEERALRASLGKPTWGLDESFLASLPAMGNAAGIAFGVDRFVMLLTGVKTINDVVPFSARERFGGR